MKSSLLTPVAAIGKVCQREYRHLDKNEAAVAYYRALISRGGLIRIESQRRVASP